MLLPEFRLGLELIEVNLEIKGGSPEKKTFRKNELFFN
jgi:hypothetical protein